MLQGLTVVNVSATTFPQTLDWLHGYLLQVKKLLDATFGFLLILEYIYILVNTQYWFMVIDERSLLKKRKRVQRKRITPEPK